MRDTPSQSWLNWKLEPLGVRLHKVPHKGMVRWCIIGADYDVSWGTLTEAWADLRQLRQFQVTPPSPPARTP